MQGVDTLWSCWVVLFANSQYRSTHFLAWPSISWDHEEIRIFPSMVFFQLFLRKFWIQTWFCICLQFLCFFHIVFECTPNVHEQGMMFVLPNQLLYWVLSTSDQCFVSFQPILCRPHTHIRIVLSRLTNKHSQFETFSQPYFNRTFSNYLSHKSRARQSPYRFRPRGTTGSSILDHDFDHLCRGRRIQMSGHSYFGIFKNCGESSIFTWEKADTASADCPAQPGSLDMISMTFAAVICEADDPCSLNTACDPESSFTISPRSTTRPLYFWNCGSNSEFLRWQRSINDAKCTVLPSFLASAITSFLSLTFVSCHTDIFSSFFVLSLHCCLCIRCFHCWGHGNKLVHQIGVTQWIHPFSRSLIFMILVRRSTRFLMDSSVSTMQAYFVLCSSTVRQVFLYLSRWCLQGIAAGIGIFNFLRAFFMISLKSSSSGSMI